HNVSTLLLRAPFQPIDVSAVEAQLRQGNGLRDDEVRCDRRFPGAVRRRLGQESRHDSVGFAERNVMESLPDLRPRLHPCGLMLAARITLPHFSVSSISLPN